MVIHRFTQIAGYAGVMMESIYPARQRAVMPSSWTALQPFHLIVAQIQ
jgi:hypothetical protein